MHSSDSLSELTSALWSVSSIFFIFLFAAALRFDFLTGTAVGLLALPEERRPDERRPDERRLLDVLRLPYASLFCRIKSAPIS